MKQCSRLLITILVSSLFYVLTACTNANIEIKNAASKFSNNNSPYLYVNGGIYDNAVITVGQCRSINFASYSPGGNSNTPSPAYIVDKDTNVKMTISAGELYTSAANCSSSTTPVQSVNGIIPKGSSTSSGAGWYFKLSSASQVTISIESDNSALKNTKINFSADLPMVKIILPTTLVHDTCYPFQAVLFEADGKIELTASSNVTYNLTSPTSNIYSISGCTSGATNSQSITINSSTTRSGFYYYKALSSGNQTLTATSTGLPTSITSPNTLVSIGPGENIIDGIVYNLKNFNPMSPNRIIPGMCMPLEIGLTNSYGVPTTSPSLFYGIKISADPSLKAVFFSDSYCTNNLKTDSFTNVNHYSDKVLFNAGDISKTIYFTANTNNASGRFYSVQHGSDLRLAKVISYPSPTYNVSAQANEPYIYADLFDLWKVTKIGSHEFPKYLQFNIPAGMTAVCESGNCGVFNSATNQLTLSQTDFNSTSFVIRVDNGSGWINRYNFSRASIYPELAVVTCGTPSSVASSVISNSTLVSYSSPICFNQGVGFTPNALYDFSNKELIGWSDNSSFINMTGTGNTFGAATSITSPTGLFNFTVNSSVTAGSSLISFSATPSIFPELSNLLINHGGASNIPAIKFSSAGSYTAKIKNVKINQTNGTDYPAIDLYPTSGTPTFVFEKLDLDSNLGQSISIQSNSVGAKTVFIRDSYIGTRQELYTFASAGSTQTNIISSTLDGGPNLNAQLINIQSSNTIVAKQSSFKSVNPSLLVNINGGSAVLSAYNNLFIQNGSNYAFSSSSIGNVTLDGNQFIRTSGGNSYLVATSSQNTNYVSSSSSSNQICSMDNTNPWAGVNSGAAPTGTFLSTPFNNYSLSPSGMCFQ